MIKIMIPLFTASVTPMKNLMIFYLIWTGEQLQLVKNNDTPNRASRMEVVNVLPPVTKQFIATTLPVHVPVISKFNNPIAHDLVSNSN